MKKGVKRTSAYACLSMFRKIKKCLKGVSLFELLKKFLPSLAGTAGVLAAFAALLTALFSYNLSKETAAIVNQKRPWVALVKPVLPATISLTKGGAVCADVKGIYIKNFGASVATHVGDTWTLHASRYFFPVGEKGVPSKSSLDLLLLPNQKMLLTRMPLCIPMMPKMVSLPQLKRIQRRKFHLNLELVLCYRWANHGGGSCRYQTTYQLTFASRTSNFITELSVGELQKQAVTGEFAFSPLGSSAK